MSEPIVCQFYMKIGACRHGEKCSRKHTRPSRSKTILMTNLYQNPEVRNKMPPTKEEVNERFEEFYKDVFVESSLIGDVDEVTVCENHNDHMNGNVYVKFRRYEDAEKARDNFSTRWFNSRPVYCELSPVNDFRDSTCRQHDTNTCDRGNTCNFMHVKRPSSELLKTLRLSQAKYYKEKKAQHV